MIRRATQNSNLSSTEGTSDLKNPGGQTAIRFSGSASGKLRKTRFLPLLALIGLLASGCSAIEQSNTVKDKPTLVESCSTVKNKLRKTTKHFANEGTFYDLQFASAGVATNMALLAGVAERKSWEDKIIKEYPFLNSVEGGKDYRGSGMGVVFLLLEATDGALFELELTGKDLQSIEEKTRKHLAGSAGGFNVAWSKREVRSLVESSIGSGPNSEVKGKGCSLVDERYNTYRVFEDALDVMAVLEETLWAIRTCRQPGADSLLRTPDGSSKCATDSYEIEEEDFGPIVLDNPWEKTWRDKWSEDTAKFAYCWEQNMAYSKSLDACVD